MQSRDYDSKDKASAFVHLVKDGQLTRKHYHTSGDVNLACFDCIRITPTPHEMSTPIPVKPGDSLTRAVLEETEVG